MKNREDQETRSIKDMDQYKEIKSQEPEGDNKSKQLGNKEHGKCPAYKKWTVEEN